jgi:hypothetical protein
MTRVIGEKIVTLKGTLDECSERTIQLQLEGFHVKWSSRYIHWPFFWIQTWTVCLSKPVVLNVREDVGYEQEADQQINKLKNELGIK